MWTFPLIFLLLIAPFTPWLDLHASTYFFHDGHFSLNPFLAFLFRYGELFGVLVGSITLIVFITAYFSKKKRHLMRGALVIGLTLLIGAGILTNSVLKKHWGRPRPKQIVEFGGQADYLPFWKPDFSTTEHRRSFPSGHVAMGFFYLSLCVVAKRYRCNWLFLTGLGLTLFWGVGLMFARVAQGGHFLSDVLVSPILMWWVTLALDRLLLKTSARPSNFKVEL